MTATVHNLDATAAAPLVRSGLYCLDQMHVGDTGREAAIRAGLDLAADVATREAALMALAAAYSDLARPPDDGEEESWTERQRRYDDGDLLQAVLRGLTPHAGPVSRERLWEDLTLAVLALDDLRGHANRGTTPAYPHRPGADPVAAMAAERRAWEREARDGACRLALAGGSAVHTGRSTQDGDE